MFFPISSDISIFLRGGETLLAGKLLYVDFIDLKAPLIYEIYAFIRLITGGGEMALRLFDLVYQLITILLIVRLCEKYFDSDIPGFFAGLAYALSYITLGFAQTLQGESFTGMWIILLFFIVLSEKKDWKHFLAMGAISGIFFSLKFTLGVVLASVILYELLFNINKKFIINTIFILIGFIIVVFITFIPLLNLESLAGFKTMLDYLAFYSAMPPIDTTFIKMAYERSGGFFADNYSLLLTSGVAIGMTIAIQGNISEKSRKILYFCIILVLMLFVSVAVEKKFGEYHFSRMLAPLAVIAGVGFFEIYSHIFRRYKLRSIQDKFIIVFLVAFGLVFSPIPRWLNLFQPPLALIKGGAHYDRIFENERAYEMMRVQHKAIAKSVNDKLLSNEKVLLIGTGAGVVNYFLKTENLSKFAQSQFYFGSYEIEVWRDEFYKELQSAQWLIVQNNDRHLYINGHQRSSLESLQQASFSGKYLKENFNEYIHTSNFNVFRRIK